MSNLNLNKTIVLTKKWVVVFCALIVFLLVISIISLMLAFGNRSKINNNYQLVSTNFNELENKVNASNIMIENVSALEKRINQVELDQKKINVDYDNLNNRTARHEQDIVLLQTIVNDKFLDSRLDNIEVSLKNNEIDIDSIKILQQTQQISLDDIANAFLEFKSQIIQKITSMLTKNASNNTSNAMQSGKITNTTNVNFPYILSSIEYRSGEKWAVFSPKNIKSLSELKFLIVGNMIDNWMISQIDSQSVKLKKENKVFVLTVGQ